MKIRVKVVCIFLTLSKKPPLFQILATRLYRALKFEELKVNIKNYVLAYNRDYFLSADDQWVSIPDDIMKKFYEHRTAMEGKPKIFWFQFCRSELLFCENRVKPKYCMFQLQTQYAPFSVQFAIYKNTVIRKNSVCLFVCMN